MFHLQLGATYEGDFTSFRVWAPKKKTMSVQIRRLTAERIEPMQSTDDGYFVARVEGVQPGDLYRFQFENQEARPDPASRFQPDGPHSWSQVVDANSYRWSDTGWKGVATNDLIIYELHVGTFSQGGTYLAAIEDLKRLADLGVTAVELLPLADCPGRWNWGYDGVNFFAPRNTYGTPDQLKAFVDECHNHGMAVLLDVVYNHLGPEGNYLAEFAPYFSRKHHTPWGSAFAFDGKYAKDVREYVIRNALYWIDEYHFDGLRFDAIHFVHDDSELHVIQELSGRLRELEQGLGRKIQLIAETNVYDPKTTKPISESGFEFDSLWCDDAMHSIMSIASDRKLTQRDYHGVTDLAESMKNGFIYEGKHPYTRNEAPDRIGQLRLDTLVVGLQTHDVVGNDPLGRRIHQLAAADFQMAAALLVFLYPSIPMMFMGEEFAAENPFLFFVDFQDQRLRKSVEKGRADEYPEFKHLDCLSPIDERAFTDSILTEPRLSTESSKAMQAWYRRLIDLRRQWRQCGLLDQKNLSVVCDVESHLFVLQYAFENESVYAACRIGHSNAKIEFDSSRVLFRSFEAEDLAELYSNQAVVGRGEFRWSVTGSKLEKPNVSIGQKITVVSISGTC